MSPGELDYHSRNLSISLCRNIQVAEWGKKIERRGTAAYFPGELWERKHSQQPQAKARNVQECVWFGMGGGRKEHRNQAGPSSKLGRKHLWLTQLLMENEH